MMLQGETIKTRPQLKRKFSIEEQYGENILKKRASFLQLSRSKAFGCELDVLLCAHIESKLLFAPDWFSQSRIDPDRFLAALAKAAARIHDDFIKNNRDKILSLLNARQTFCEAEARLLWLLMLLHIQAMSDITESGMQYMIGLLDEKKAPQRIPVDRTTLNMSLPMGDRWNSGLTRKTLDYQGLRLCVCLEGTTQRRTLFYRESLSYFESDGKCLFFLPRDLDQQDDGAWAAYGCAMQEAYHGAPDSLRERIAKPILDRQLRCAGYLLKDGSVHLGDGRQEGCALDAAADEERIYLATEHGVDVINRKDRQWKSWISCDSVIEEILIDRKTGAVSLRTDSCSLAISAKQHPSEEG